MAVQMAVVFDLDGTLIDSLPSIARAGNAVLTSEGLAELVGRTVSPDDRVGGTDIFRPLDCRNRTGCCKAGCFDGAVYFRL